MYQISRSGANSLIVHGGYNKESGMFDVFAEQQKLRRAAKWAGVDDVDAEEALDWEKEEGEDVSLVKQFLQSADIDEGQVKHWIEVFFKDRKMHYGGPIPAAALYSPSNINQVMRLDVAPGVLKANLMIKYNKGLDLSIKNGFNFDEEEVKSAKEDEDASEFEIDDASGVIINLLQECGRLGIPKYFAAGLMVMALELCWGIEQLNLVSKF
jgi:hypothetical protein